MKKKTALEVLIFIGLFFAWFPAKAQKEFSVFQYTSKNGLPQNSVKSLIKDDNGFLWMTTEGGLVRFDGRNFKTFDKSNTPFMKADRLKDIFKTQLNELLAFDGIGNAYQIQSNGIIAAKPHPFPNEEFYFSNSSIHKKNYYASAFQTGLIIYHKALPADTIVTVAYDVLGYFMIDNSLYFLNKKCDLFKIDITNRKIISRKLICNTSFKSPVVFYRYGHPGAFIKEGFKLFEIVPGSKQDELKAELLCNELPLNCVVLDIYYDKSNKILYVGTDSKGLFLFKEKFIHTQLYSNPEESTNNAYYSQVELDSNTSLSHNGRAFSLNQVAKNNLPFSFNRQGVIRDKEDNIWYNKSDNLYKYNLITKKNKLITGPVHQFAYCFAEQHDTMWIGTTHDISFVHNDSLHIVFNWEETLISNFPYTILIAPDDKLWFSNGVGVYRLDRKSFKVDTLADLNMQIVRNLITYNDYIFIGTYGNGYYIYKEGRLVHIPLDKNNYLSQTHTFVFDSAGYVWMTTNRGLFKARTNDLIKYFSDSTIKINYIYYGEEDGISNSEFNGGCSPAHLVLKNGYVSLPTMDGMVWFKPSDIFDASPYSPILVDAVYFDDKIADTAALKNVPSSVQSLRVDFATPYWGNNYNLHLEYKLEGFNRQWNVLENEQNSIVFSNLHSGNYTLLIRKRTGFNVNDFVVKPVSITVQKRFFETLWFLLLCLFGATIFVIAVARIYARNIKKRNKQLEEKVQERTFELGKANEQMQRSVEIKDKLISILSHDILTPLRFISMVARKGGDPHNDIEKENMRNAFHDIKNTTDKLRDNTQNILNWIKHQNKRINVNNTHISVRDLTDEVAGIFKEMADSKGINIVNNISHDDVIKTDRNILSIILHNIIGNAVKFTEHGNITIQSKPTDEKYFITIADTGEGMSSEQLNHIQNLIEKKTFTSPNPSSGESGNGLGYVIISELIELLKGSITVKSIEDQGTCVTLSLGTQR